MIVDLRQDRLTVRLKEAPLDAVLEEIGRRVPVEITILGALRDPLSIQFRDLPLEEGLAKLLRGHGWARLYGRARPGEPATLKRIVIVPASAGGVGAAAPGQESAGAKAQAVAALFGREDVRTLLDAHLHGRNARVRRDAMRGLLGAIRAEDLGRLIDLVQDDRVRPADWEIILAPLSGILSLQERWGMLRSLADPEARERLAQMLGSYLAHKRRESGQTP